MQGRIRKGKDDLLIKINPLGKMESYPPPLMEKNAILTLKTPLIGEKMIDIQVVSVTLEGKCALIVIFDKPLKIK